MGPPPSKPAPLLSYVDVTKTFTDAAEPLAAVGPVNLTVDAGAFVALIGPSGSGKSTLLRLAADLLQPTAGAVTVCGQSPQSARLQRLFSLVFQQPVLFEWRTVAGNVALPLELARQPGSVVAAAVDRALALVGLTDGARLMPRQLSGGMQQRAALARALVSEPRLLIMDEPFGALDELTREHLNQELLGVWAATGLTALFVTHSIEEAVFLADRVVVLSARPGRVVGDVEVDLPRPRQPELRAQGHYFERVGAVRQILRAAEAD